MLNLTLALVTSTLSPIPFAETSYTTSPLAEFLTPAASANFAPETSASDAADSLLSYTYIEVGAAKNDVDDFDEDVDIYYGRGSFNLLAFLYLFGEYSNQSTDFGNTDTDVIELGAGAHFGVLPTLDVFAEVGVLFSDVSSDIDELDDSETGYRVEGGVRWLVLPWTSGGLELDASVGTISLDNRLGSDEDPTFFSLGARAHFLKFLSVGAAYEKIEDDDQIVGNVRFSF